MFPGTTSSRLQTFLSKLDAHIAKTTSQPDDSKADKKNSKSNTPVEAAAEENVLDFVNEIKAQATINTFQQAGFIYEVSGLLPQRVNISHNTFLSSRRRGCTTIRNRSTTTLRNMICIIMEMMEAGTASIHVPMSLYSILARKPVKQSKR